MAIVGRQIGPPGKRKSENVNLAIANARSSDLVESHRRFDAHSESVHLSN